MAPPQDESALQRLATLVTRRRVELGMNKIDVARAAQLQINTYSKVEEGKSVRPTTYGKIEPVLGWANGACSDILDGATAATAVERRQAGAVVSGIQPGDLAADIADAVQDAAVSVSDSLTSAEIREMKRRVVDELIRRGKLPAIDRD
jgi:transcriptional regulator with XRE-family HTH domain